MGVFPSLEFEVLQKAYVKSKSVLDTEDGPPKFFIKSIGELEDFVQTVREEEGWIERRVEKFILGVKYMFQYFKYKYFT